MSAEEVERERPAVERLAASVAERLREELHRTVSMDAKTLELLSDVIANAIREAITPRDQKIALLEEKFLNLQKSMSLDQRVKSLEQRIERSDTPRVSFDSPDVSDLVQ